MTASQRSTTSLDITDRTINNQMYAKKPKNDVTYMKYLLIDILLIIEKFTKNTLYKFILRISDDGIPVIHIALIIKRL